MKSTIDILVVVIALLYVSGMKISFKPFKIEFTDLYFGLGCFFILLAVICFNVSSFTKGEISGYKELYEDIKKEYQSKK